MACVLAADATATHAAGLGLEGMGMGMDMGIFRPRIFTPVQVLVDGGPKRRVHGCVT